MAAPGKPVVGLLRQGYVSLLSGGTKVVGDTAAMVAARAEFLEAGHYAPITEAVATAVSVVAMGPSAWHADPEDLRARIADLPKPLTPTASVTVARYARRG
ncbi:hypothetical protein [Saccharopolyspora sp. ASAGF58]|uniref:hypothetical protein n=1 Tax=Saccharopolyspora sp. ASAGF58 TaxID=2719023 RepID=UPI001B3058F7|nr:hypothetical protein [Saccharopolyspora sp. ASAGF58]